MTKTGGKRKMSQILTEIPCSIHLLAYLFGVVFKYMSTVICTHISVTVSYSFCFSLSNLKLKIFNVLLLLSISC